MFWDDKGTYTWVLEIGEPQRFNSLRQAVSYCGLCSAQRESAGKEQRGPTSRKRNKHLQTVFIEAAKIAPLWNSRLAELHEKELKKGNRNRATLAVARRLVAYLLAVDRRQTDFVQRAKSEAAKQNSGHSVAATMIFPPGLADDGTVPMRHH